MEIDAYSNILFRGATAALRSFTFVLLDGVQGSPKRPVSAWAPGSTWGAFVLPSAQHSHGVGNWDVNGQQKVWWQPSPTEMVTLLLPLPGPYLLQARDVIRQQHQHAQLSAGIRKLQDLHFLCSHRCHFEGTVLTHHLHRSAFLLQKQKCETTWPGSNFFFRQANVQALWKGQDSMFKQVAFEEELYLHFSLLPAGVPWETGQTQLLQTLLGLRPRCWQWGSQLNHPTCDSNRFYV